MKSTQEEGKGQDEGLFAENEKGASDAAEIKESEKPQMITPQEFEKRAEASQSQRKDLDGRSALPTGNPDAKVTDPIHAQVVPRYDVVQNRSISVLIIPDLKNSPDDRGLVLQPGEAIKLSDFYSPQEINRSRGLRHAATKINGIADAFALVPLRTEEEAEGFKAPERKKYAKGTTLEDTVHNDFDDRFEELDMREAKREEKLLKKTLGMRRTKEHGKAPSNV